MDIEITEKKIEYVRGSAIPKPEPDQDTDAIVPARFLKEITFGEMGTYVYFDERARHGDQHPFNDPRYKGATILVAGENYGCGSSREHAPQALKRFGINAIIAESFAEIFASNCESLGVLGVIVSKEDIAKLTKKIKSKPKEIFIIDLIKKLVLYGRNKELSLELPEGRRQSFLNGTWDAMAVLQQTPQETERTKQGLKYLTFQ